MGDVSTITLFFLLLVAAASVLGRLLRVPYPIVLVIGSSAAGFVPGLPAGEINPDIVLFVLLPPLLYHAASTSSLRDLRDNARPITMSAVGLVLATMGLVAVVAHAVVPGMHWPAAFALGAVVSPTDPLAATEIAARLGVPRRATVIIEGESLVNDGSALVVLQTAVAAAFGVGLEWWQTGGLFVLEVLGGVAVGLVVAGVMSWLVPRLHGDDLLYVVLSLACGYLAYLPADELHLSGVLAVVSAGAVMGHRGHAISTASSRLQNDAFWSALVFLLNAVLFVSVGLELPSALRVQDRTALDLVVLGLLVSAVTILTRLVWMHTVPYLIRVIDRRPSQLERRATWRVRTVSAWCGLRGAVSLAAALSLPLDFPQRGLIVFLTLCVIWATLVGQGLTLPTVIRMLRVEGDDVAAREELHGRKAATRAALDELERVAEQDWAREDTVERLRGLYEFRQRRLLQRAGVADETEEDAEGRSRDYQRIVRALLAAQHRELVRLRDVGEIGDDALLIVGRELDLEEERLDS